MIYFDISDIVVFSQCSNVVSGIQRVVFNLAKELRSENNVKFIYRNLGNGKWYSLEGVSFPEDGDIRDFNLLNENWKLSRIKWSFTKRRILEKRGFHKIKHLVRFFKSVFVRPILKSDRVIVKGMCIENFDVENIREEDYLVIPSIPQNALEYRSFIEGLPKKIKVCYFFHDIIPVVTPEYVWGEENKNFIKYIDLMHSTASLLLTSANYNVEDYKRYIYNRFGLYPQYEIKAIGLPVDFSVNIDDSNFYNISPIGRRLKNYHFCLSVGSIGPRKNHFELLQAWKKFYDSDKYNNQILVVAGTPWPSCPDIVSLLRSNFCGGSVIFIESPSDVELAYLYKYCKFTICISLYEGWGLPVSESLAVGKPVIVLDQTTLKEAGYGVASLVKSRDLEELRNRIDVMFNDDNFYTKEIEKVNNAKKLLPSWCDFANNFKSSLKNN